MFPQMFVCPQGGLPSGGLPPGGGVCPIPSQYRYPVAAIAVVGTHPIGMHSCSVSFYSFGFFQLLGSGDLWVRQKKMFQNLFILKIFSCGTQTWDMTMYPQNFLLLTRFHYILYFSVNESTGKFCMMICYQGDKIRNLQEQILMSIFIFSQTVRGRGSGNDSCPIL